MKLLITHRQLNKKNQFGVSDTTSAQSISFQSISDSLF